MMLWDPSQTVNFNGQSIRETGIFKYIFNFEFFIDVEPHQNFMLPMIYFEKVIISAIALTEDYKEGKLSYGKFYCYIVQVNWVIIIHQYMDVSDDSIAIYCPLSVTKWKPS